MHDTAKQNGMTLIEMAAATTILIVGVVALASVVLSADRLQRTTKERTVAYNAVRAVIEEMRQTEFAQVHAIYNDDENDDPDGPGTARGPSFEVDGLHGVDGRPVGRIEFPDESFDGGFVLREDIRDEALGMPDGLDLDGDGEINGAVETYVILPVRIILEWREGTSSVTMRSHTFLTER